MATTAPPADAMPSAVPPLELIGAGVLILVPHGDDGFAVRDLNRRAGDLLGLGPAEAQVPLTDRLSGTVGRRLAEGLRACAGAGSERELEVQAADAAPARWLRFVLAPQMGAQGNVEQIVVTVSDVTGRKQAEAQSLASELKFTGLVEGSIQAIVVIRRDRALFCNAACAEIFGVESPAQFCRQPSMVEIVHPDDRDDIAEAFRAMARGERPAERRTYRCLRADGSTFWVEAFPSLVMWDDEPALQLTLHDITERVQAEAAVQESEARYRTLVESSLQGIVVHVDERPVFANDAAGRLAGYPGAAAYLAAKDLRRYAHIAEADQARARALDHELITGAREVVNTDVNLRRADGSTGYAQVQVRRVNWQGQAALMTTLIDITQRVRAEQALQESRALLQAVFDAFPAWVIVKDRKQRALLCNRNMLEAIGCEESEVLGRSTAESHWLSPEDRVRAAASDQHTLDTGERWENPGSPTLLPDGRTIITRVIKVPLRDADGHITGLVAVVMDVTAQHRLDTELRESRALLQSVFDALPVWVVVKDRASRYVLANRQALIDFDVSAEELPTLSTATAPWLDEAQRADMLAQDRQVLQTGEWLETPEIEQVTRGGRHVTMHGLRVPLRGADGDVTGIVFIAQDITRYKEAEAAVAASEARYRTLVESSLQGITVHQQGRPVFVNDRYAQSMGYRDAAEFLALNGDKVLPQAAPEAREATMKRSQELESGRVESAASERDSVTRDGTRRTMQILSRRIEWDGAPAVLSTTLDITERKRAETTLRASEERYRALVEGSVQGIAVFSLRDHRALFVNDTKLALEGSPSQDAFQRTASLFDNLREPHLGTLRSQTERMAAGEIDRFEGDVQMHPAGREPYWAAFIAQRIQWEGEAAVQITSMDITDRKRAEEALKDRQALLTKQNEYYRQDLSRRRGRQDQAIVAESQAMRRVLHEAEMVARSRVPVLIEGPTGSGKEVVSEFIHRHSDRADHLLSVVNCGALSETLMDAELFGHERGAFTGATDARAGLIEIADRGTLFLDEIGDLPPSAQVRLLRFLERGVVRRVGSTRERKVDVRILAATHKTLKEQVQAGTFREDLYHRLLVIRIEVPPLRERIEDILPLARRFCALACQEAHLEPLEFSEDARLALTAHDWPGNVRELSHTVQRAVFATQLDGAAELRPEHLDLPLPGDSEPALLPIKEVTRRAEQQHVRAVLRHCDGNRRKAAEVLGISERHLYRLLG